MELRTIKRAVATVGAVVVLTIGWFSFTETVGQGHVGVVFNKAKGGVQSQPLSEGLHFVSPLSRITEYPVSTETVKYKLSLPTGDTKTILFPVSFDYHNESAKTPAIYKEWRGQRAEDLQTGYLRRNLLSIASDVTSKYTILELNAHRGEIQAEILKQFTERVSKKGFVIIAINLGTPEYDAQTQQAIQQVVTKQQELKGMELDKQKAEIQAQKDKIVAEGKAQAEVAKAKGDAESTLLKADATAKANKEIQASLTGEILEYQKLNKWNGVNSSTVLGGQGVNVNVK